MMIANKIPNILVITPSKVLKRFGSREALGRTNIKVIGELFGDRLTVLPLSTPEKRGAFAFIMSLLGYVDGVSTASLKTVRKTIRDGNIDLIFLEGSNLGLIAKDIKKHFPSTRIVTFFHNVEAYFFFDSFRLNKTLRSLGVLIANFLAERSAVKWSDQRIVLNTRDGNVLKNIYACKQFDISNFYVPEQNIENIQSSAPLENDRFCIFVGSSFYANVEGIRWFAKNVSPYIKLKTIVIGRGLEYFKAELELNNNVIVIGTVDNIASWYTHAEFVIAPIFKGSGMKTKVAEALQYGKRVIGTAEAFTGYESYLPTIGKICDTQEDFVKSIDNLLETKKTGIDNRLIDIYEGNFSFRAYKKRINELINGSL